MKLVFWTFLNFGHDNNKMDITFLYEIVLGISCKKIGLEAFREYASGPNFLPPWATILTELLDCSTKAALTTPQKVLNNWKLVERKLLYPVILRELVYLTWHLPRLKSFRSSHVYKKLIICASIKALKMPGDVRWLALSDDFILCY